MHMMEQPLIFSLLDMFIPKKLCLLNLSFFYLYIIEIDNSELWVIGDFTTISTLESLRLHLHVPDIANRCKISYNPELGIVYFYNIQIKKA